MDRSKFFAKLVLTLIDNFNPTQKEVVPNSVRGYHTMGLAYK